MSLPVQTIVEDILSLVGLHEDGGGGPTAENQMRCVRVLNMLLGEWDTKLSINPKQMTEVVAPSLADRIIVGTDTTTTPPPDIVAESMDIQSVTVEVGVVVYQCKQITLAEYEAITVKTVTAIPQFWAWDYQTPNSNIWFWPRPYSGLNIRITGTPTISKVISQAEIDLPDWYYKALVFCGAEMLQNWHPVAGLDMTNISKEAARALTGIKHRNARMRMPKASTGYESGRNSDSLWTSPMAPPVGGP